MNSFMTGFALTWLLFVFLAMLFWPDMLADWKWLPVALGAVLVGAAVTLIRRAWR